MTRRTTICIAAIMQMALNGALLANMVPNGTFAKGLHGWQVGPGASLDTRIHKTSELTNERTDENSLRLESSHCWNIASTRIGVKEGGRYRVKLHMRLQDAKQSHAKVDWLNAQNKVIGTQFLCVGMDGDSEWFKLISTCVAPEGACFANIMVLSGGTQQKKGTVWVDEVSMKEVGANLVRQKAWQKAVIQQYGPDGIASPMREKILYIDYERMGSVGVKRIEHYFTNNGFGVRNAPELKKWMLEQIKKGADGSVCVVAMGIIPVEVAESKDEALYKKYMLAGGRLVWIGDVPMFYRSFPRRFVLVPFSGGSQPLELGGGRWNVPSTTEITDLGRKWGLTTTSHGRRCDTNLTNVSAVLSRVVGYEHSGTYFVNYNARYPYSGWLRYRADGFFNSNDDESLQNLYRLSLYRGQTITAPPVTKIEKPAEDPVAIETRLKNYYRGTIVPVTIRLKKNDQVFDQVKLTVSDAGKVVERYSLPLEAEQKFVWKTEKLAANKDYELAVEFLARGNCVAQTKHNVYLAPKRNEKLAIGLYDVRGAGSFTDLMWGDVADHLGEAGLVVVGPIGNADYSYTWDAALKYGLQISFGSHAYYKTCKPKNPREKELAMRLSNGAVPTYHYLGYLPAPLCFGNSEIRQLNNKHLEREIKKAVTYPAFKGLVFINDDVALFGNPGEHLLACYCDSCKARFRKMTGHDAPTESKHPMGFVDDNDPLYQWMRFRSRDVYGEWHGLMQQTASSLHSNARLVPLPAGGYRSPVLLPDWALNPVDNYGRLNAAGYYYYPQSNPASAFLTYSELARMGNRDKEMWVLPQSLDYANILRSPEKLATLVKTQFYHLLNCGVTGMGYFSYAGVPGTPNWPVLKEVAQKAIRLGPFYLSLKKAQPEVAVLASYADASYRYWGKDSRRPYEATFLTLRKAGIVCDFIADDEVKQSQLSKYKVLVVPETRYMLKSVHKQVEDFIAAGGIVLRTPGTKVKFSKAKTVRVASLSKVITRLGLKQINVSSPDMLASAFEAGRGRLFTFANCSQTKAVKGDVVLPGLSDYVLYDLYAQREIPSESTKKGQKCELDIPAAEGAMILALPEKIQQVEVNVADSGSDGTINLQASVLNADGAPIDAGMPIEIQVHDQQGNLLKEYSDWYVTTNGKLEIQFAPAKNDPRGQWTVTAKESCSGRSNKVRVRLQK